MSERSIEEVAEAIRTMRIRGAANIARSAATALKEIAMNYSGNDPEALRSELEKGKRLLLSSRPTAVSLWNAVHLVMRGSRNVESLDALRNLIIQNADNFLKRSIEAERKIGEIGARRIRDGDTVLTHCNSSMALGVIRTAFRQGKNINVIATESRPWRQGLLTVKQLAEEEIPVTLIIDSAVRHMMREVDIVVVGADTIASNGAVINKIGTSQIALAAHEARVPFIVCAETYKFSPKTLIGELVEIEERSIEEIISPSEIPEGVRVMNPVFDATPPEYIDCIVSEIGIISPFAAYEVIVSQLGQEFLFEDLEE